MALISTFPALPLTLDCKVVFEAWATDWSAEVTGVVIKDPVLYGLNLTAEASQGTPVAPVGPFMLVPGPGA